MKKAVYSPEAAEPASSESVADRISERYGIPKAEVEALLGGNKPIPTGEAHPMTMGALMNKQQQPIEPMTQDNKWHPIAMLGMVLGILGILALGAAIILILKWNGHLATPEMAAEHTVAPAPSRVDSTSQAPDTAPNFVIQDSMTLEEMEAMPHEEAKPAKQQVKRKAPMRRHYTTSNNLEAQERLAEMRAEGNRRAKIQRITKGGVTLYQVR